jgi:hypothetical protein
MPLEPFDQLYPDVARAEMRVCDTPGFAEIGLSTLHFLREFYCTDSDCDCRRVVVQFLPRDGPFHVAASINFGWEKEKYYRTWSRHTDLWREMAGATLDPLLEQGPKKALFLKAFKQIIEDRTLVAAFRRHYALVKAGLESELPF